MATYKETTLDEFRSALTATINGEKAGLTICYRGLDPRDRREARRLIREQHDLEAGQTRAARSRLDTNAARVHSANAAHWGEILERLLLISSNY